MNSFNSKNSLLSPPKRSTFSKFLTLLFLLFFIFSAWVSFEAYTFLSTPAETPGKKIVITVTAGSSFDKVAWALKKEHAITDVKKFKLLAKYKGDLGKVKVGNFSIDTNWTPSKVLYQITKGPEILSRLSFREGLTWWQTAKEIEKQKFARYDDFVAVIHDPEFLKEHAIPFDSAEGFLFPETYFLSRPKTLDREQAKNIASILVKTFWRKTAGVWKRLPSAKGENLPRGYGKAVANIGKDISGLPPLPKEPDPTLQEAASDDIEQEPNAPYEDEEALTEDADQLQDIDENAIKKANSEPVLYGKDPSAVGNFTPPTSPANISPESLKNLVILASLVERETGLSVERPRVAGVYANRLRINMLLQCDPSVMYGIGPSFTRPLKRSQLTDETNPYNTYKRRGLPPGPIGSVGVPALTAALMPENHDYLYFVATGKGRGHTFSKTLAQHNKAVRVYRLTSRRK